MPVAQADLSLRRSAVLDDDPNINGGRLSTTLVGSTLFPDITGAQRAAGITRWRKIFLKNEAGVGTLPNKESDPNLGLLDSKLFLMNTSASQDYFLMKAASNPFSVQSDETDSSWSGTGELVADVGIDGITLDVECEVAGSLGEIFKDGETVLIADGATREFLTLDAVGGVSWASDTATLTFTDTPLQHDYTAKLSDTADIYSATTIGKSTANYPSCTNKRIRIISGKGAGQKRRIISNTSSTFTVEYEWTDVPDATSVYEVLMVSVSQCVSVGTVACSYSNVDVQSVSGTFTPGIILYPVGCVDDTWTLTFANGTTFTLSGLETGDLGSFTISPSDIKPQNGSSFYFKIETTAFGGTFATGNTVTFDTSSASKSVWIKEVVPAGTLPHRSDAIDIGASGDTL